MSQVTFSSSVLVDDGTTPTSRFASFDLTLADAQALEQLRDESATRYALSFIGSGARAAHALLKNLEARVLLNGQPSMTIDGLLVAACIGQGELVTLTADLYSRGAADNKETLSVTGIITNVVWTAAAGPLGQRIDLVLHRCHKVWIRSGGTVTSYTDPSAE